MPSSIRAAAEVRRLANSIPIPALLELRSKTNPPVQVLATILTVDRIVNHESSSNGDANRGLVGSVAAFSASSNGADCAHPCCVVFPLQAHPKIGRSALSC